MGRSRDRRINGKLVNGDHLYTVMLKNGQTEYLRSFSDYEMDLTELFKDDWLIVFEPEYFLRGTEDVRNFRKLKNNKCDICGAITSKGVPYTILPPIYGGEYCMDNFGLRCADCDREVKASLSAYKKRIRSKNVLSPGKRGKIWEKFNGKCAVCKKSYNEHWQMHVDHIIPISLGGDSEECNLQLLCVYCNAKKGSRLPILQNITYFSLIK